MNRAVGATNAIDLDWAGAGIALLGFCAVAAVAGTRGGYFPESWAWLATATLFPAVVVLLATGHVRLGWLDLSFVGLLFSYWGWVLLSATWSASMTRSILESQHDLAYIGVVLLALLLTSRRTAPHLVAGVLAGVTAISGYSVFTRVLPDRFGRFDSIAGYRLTGPIGYWNGLGIFAAMGALLALGLAARARTGVARGLASALPVVLLLTVFFTFSRGAWLGFTIGLATAIALDPRRLQLILTTLVLAPWSAAAVWLASRRHALTTVGSRLDTATAQGHSLVVVAALLALGSGLTGFAVGFVGDRVSVPTLARRAFAGTLIALVLAGVSAVWVAKGSPAHLATAAWHSFHAEPKPGQPTLTNRLTDLSSNGRLALWRTSAHDFERHPLLGTGGGTFAISWAARGTFTALDGHSLYMETLGELGAVGLLLIVGVIAMPLVAAVRARHSLILPSAVGAFAAFAVHAGVDWDWELSGVTIVALLSGAALVASARRDEGRIPARPLRLALIPVAAILAVLACGSVLGNVPLGHARDALDADTSLSSAQRDARTAFRWAPWSSEPLRILGEAQLNSSEPRRARATFHQALGKDPASWELWLDLALATSGREQRTAIERAYALNPRSYEVQQVLASL
jgi:hypothetical protein